MTSEEKDHDASFKKSLSDLMDGCRIVAHARYDLDCCGRPIRTCNIVEVPHGRLAAFRELAASNSCNDKDLENATDGFFLKATFSQGPFTLNGRSRDYDGITLVDSSDVRIDCVFSASVTAFRAVRGPVPRFSFLCGVVEVDGVQIHPVDDIVGFSKRTHGYDEFFDIDHPFGAPDTTVVCFMKELDR